MAIPVKAATIAKEIFVIFSFLLLTGVAAIGATLFTDTDSSTRTVAQIRAKSRRLEIQRFLADYVGWKGTPASGMGPSGQDETYLMLRDLPGFWNKVSLFDSSLTTIYQAKLLDIPACSAAFESNAQAGATETADQYSERIKSHISPALDGLNDLLDGIKQSRGMPNGQVGSQSLGTIAYFSTVNAGMLGALRSANWEREQLGQSWICRDGADRTLSSLVPSSHKDTGPTPGRLLNEAIGTDSFGDKVRVMTPKEFEVFYDTEETALQQSIADESGRKVVSLATFLPPLPIASWVRDYPWLVVAGVALALSRIRRVSKALRRSDVSVDFEEADFPANLFVPSGVLRDSGFADHIVAWTLLILPSVAVMYLMYLQIGFADFFTNSISGADTPETVEVLKQLTQANVPVISEAVGVAMAILLSVMLIVQIETAVSRLHEASARTQA